MAWQQIGSGGVLDAGTILSLEENDVPEGGLARLALDMRVSPGAALISAIKSALDASGVPDNQVYAGSPVLNVVWRKGFEWTLVVIAIILLLVAVILIIGWRFFKENPVTANVLVFVGLALVGVALILKSRRKR